MADGEASAGPTLQPKHVEYDPLTGVPSEFNEYLPPDSIEYKKWKASMEGPEAMDKLTLRDKDGNEIEKQLPGGKVKKKSKPMILIERNTRNKKKMITTVTGLETFGIKLAEASKMFGKKFACGCSVTKGATGAEQIDMQGDFLDELANLVLKTYSASHKVEKDNIYYIDEKKKKPYFGDEDDDDSADE